MNDSIRVYNFSYTARTEKQSFFQDCDRFPNLKIVVNFNDEYLGSRGRATLLSATFFRFMQKRKSNKSNFIKIEVDGSVVNKYPKFIREFSQFRDSDTLRYILPF